MLPMGLCSFGNILINSGNDASTVSHFYLGRTSRGGSTRLCEESRGARESYMGQLGSACRTSNIEQKVENARKRNKVVTVSAEVR